VLTANSVLLGMTVGTVAALAAAATVVALGTDALPISGYGHLAMALAATPFAMTVLYVNNILVLRSRIDLVNWGAVLGALAQCVLLLLLVTAGRPSVGSVVALWSVSMIVPLTLLLPAVRPRFRERDLPMVRHALTRGLRYHVGSASFFLLSRVDILILNALAPTAAVGSYALAVTLAELARISTDALSQVALARQMESDHGDAVDLTIRTTRLGTLLALASSALICLAAPFLIPVVYGSAYAGSVPPLLGLAPGLLAFGVARSIVTFLVRLNRPLLTSAMSVAGLLLNVVLNLTMIPHFGIMGCAVASSASYIVLAVMQCAWFLRATQTPLRRLLPGGDWVRNK
jgi:O-antigen/teichoic acid export membrane protein